MLEKALSLKRCIQITKLDLANSVNLGSSGASLSIEVGHIMYMSALIIKMLN